MSRGVLYYSFILSIVTQFPKGWDGCSGRNSMSLIEDSYLHFESWLPLGVSYSFKAVISFTWRQECHLPIKAQISAWSQNLDFDFKLSVLSRISGRREHWVSCWTREMQKWTCQGLSPPGIWCQNSTVTSFCSVSVRLGPLKAFIILFNCPLFSFSLTTDFCLRKLCWEFEQK